MQFTSSEKEEFAKLQAWNEVDHIWYPDKHKNESNRMA